MLDPHLTRQLGIGGCADVAPRPAVAAARFDVVGLGEIAVDDVLLVEGTPVWGGKAKIVRRDRLGGGQVATAMVALARLGLRTALVGAVGDDEAGRFALAGLAEEGVDTSGVRVVRGRTRRATVVVDGSANRTVLSEEDDRLCLDAASLDAAEAGAGRVLHLDGTAGHLIAAARLARERGRLVSCDLDTPDPRDPSCSRWSTCASCPRATSRRPPRAPAARQPAGDHPGRGRRRRLDLRCRRVDPLAHLPGRAGGRHHRLRRHLPPGFLAALLEGRDFAASLRFANAAAALKVKDLGRRGCPARAAVLALLATP